MQFRTLSIICLALASVSCDGGNSASNAGGNSPGDASPGGIWRGTDSVTGLNVLGVVDEAGNFRLIRSDRLQYVGTAEVQGSSLSGALDSYSDRGTTFPDGSMHGSGSVTGRVIERDTLNLAIANNTDNGTASTSNLLLTYDATYENKSSLAAIEGTYIEASSGTVFMVDAGGHFSARQAALGCQVDGAVSIIDPNSSLYEISYSYSSCGGAAAYLNGVTVTGLGIFNTAASAAQVLIAVSYTAAGQKVGLIVELNRQ